MSLLGLTWTPTLLATMAAPTKIRKQVYLSLYKLLHSFRGINSYYWSSWILPCQPVILTPTLSVPSPLRRLSRYATNMMCLNKNLELHLWFDWNNIKLVTTSFLISSIRLNSLLYHTGCPSVPLATGQRDFYVKYWQIK